MSDYGRFITLEGGEGTGKSTQANLLARRLRSVGIDTLATREPGGEPGAEEIRKLLVRGEVHRWSPMTEALLNYAARREHLGKVVMPALKAGRWVVSDRFADSTLAYQGYGHGLALDKIHALHELVLGRFQPDLTLILDLPEDAGLARATAGADGAEDRYERMDVDFHRRLRQGFLEIAREAPDRCVVIDASGDVETVLNAIRDVVRARLGIALP
ncbi:MAG: dTMP kinase [Rhodobacterales bacterium]|nr:dTMP kinase [Rhodobacterales bacterium]